MCWTALPGQLCRGSSAGAALPGQLCRDSQVDGSAIANRKNNYKQKCFNSQGLSVSLPNDFNHQIYQPDFTVLFTVRKNPTKIFS